MTLNAQELRTEVETSIMEIARFVETEEFQDLLVELWHTPREERQDFVKNVILNEEEREKRGIEVPPRMVIQRSAFGDQRPTLFCVSKMLSDGKRKTTITFDNEGLKEPPPSS